MSDRYSFDKDLLERRVHHLEADHTQSARRDLEQLLRVGAGLEPQLRVITVVVHRVDQRISLETCRAVAFVVDLHEAPPIAVLDLAEASLQDGFAPIDQAN